MTVICQALACLFAFVVLQPAEVHYDYAPAPAARSSR